MLWISWTVTVVRKCEVAQSFVLCFDLYRFVVMFRLQRLPKADRYLTWEV